MDINNKARIHWACRRGMRELDISITELRGRSSNRPEPETAKPPKKGKHRKGPPTQAGRAKGSHPRGKKSFGPRKPGRGPRRR